MNDVQVDELSVIVWISSQKWRSLVHFKFRCGFKTFSEIILELGDYTLPHHMRHLALYSLDSISKMRRLIHCSVSSQFSISDNLCWISGYNRLAFFPFISKPHCFAHSRVIPNPFTLLYVSSVDITLLNILFMKLSDLPICTS